MTTTTSLQDRFFDWVQGCSSDQAEYESALKEQVAAVKDLQAARRRYHAAIDEVARMRRLRDRFEPGQPVRAPQPDVSVDGDENIEDIELAICREHASGRGFERFRQLLEGERPDDWPTSPGARVRREEEDRKNRDCADMLLKECDPDNTRMQDHNELPGYEVFREAVKAMGSCADRMAKLPEPEPDFEDRLVKAARAVVRRVDFNRARGGVIHIRDDRFFEGLVQLKEALEPYHD